MRFGPRSLLGRFRRDGRGQTANDYALGVSVFLLTVLFVFAFVPTVFSPFRAPIDDATTARADRASSYLVGSLSEERTNVVPSHRAEAFFTNNKTAADIREYVGLSAATSVNVAMSEPDSDVVGTVNGTQLGGGDPVRDGPTAASSRIVVVERPDGSRTVYRLTVRIW